MEAVAASVDAVGAIEGGPLYRESLAVGAQANEPPLLGMMPVYRPAGENRPGGALVETQDVPLASEGSWASSSLGVRPWQLRTPLAT